jgi:hypothetical protein
LFALPEQLHGQIHQWRTAESARRCLWNTGDLSEELRVDEINTVAGIGEGPELKRIVHIQPDLRLIPLPERDALFDGHARADEPGTGGNVPSGVKPVLIKVCPSPSITSSSAR